MPPDQSDMICLYRSVCRIECWESGASCHTVTLQWTFLIVGLFFNIISHILSLGYKKPILDTSAVIALETDAVHWTHVDLFATTWANIGTVLSKCAQTVFKQ